MELKNDRPGAAVRITPVSWALTTTYPFKSPAAREKELLLASIAGAPITGS
ncbi:MAG: hypothetical protein ACR2NN_27410 [Bryobacteraceae bacterium]